VKYLQKVSKQNNLVPVCARLDSSTTKTENTGKTQFGKPRQRNKRE